MIYTERPPDFKTTAPAVVACYLVCNGAFLLLQRQLHKPYGGSWGLPAGKVDEGECLNEAVVREVFEETGITIISSELTSLQPLWVRHGDHEFMYHSFSISLDERPEVRLSTSEHQAYAWTSKEEARDLELIQDLAECNVMLLRDIC